MIALFYSCAIMISSFIVLQTRWDQARIIMVIIPMLFLVIFYGIYQSVKKSSIGQNIYVILIVITCASVFISSTKKSIHNLPILKQNIKGDVYFGYTPDWVNFLKASEWCGSNLPPNSKVASRKAPMSFIYGKGMQFYGVYNVVYKDPETKQSNPDSVLALFHKTGVTHFLLSSLRMMPNKNNGNIINTMNNVIEPVAKKYPEKIKLVQQIGDTEPTYIYEIIY